MKLKNYGLFISFLLSVQFVIAQSPGDTIVVHALNYQTKTRDTLVQFPNIPSINYQKVIMRYSMRCKNGLISDGNSRNRGCGEWDYSCNTYISDSTRADSVLKSIDRYQIIPDTAKNTVYSSTPTWLGQQLLQHKVMLQSIVHEDTAVVGTGNFADSSMIQSMGNGGKTYWLMTAAELKLAGLDSGYVNGFNLNNLGGMATLYNFKVQLKATALYNLNKVDTAVFNGLKECYFHNYSMVNGKNRINFYNPFLWNGNSNILMEISYKGKSTNAPIILKSDTFPIIKSLTTADDRSFNFFPGNYVEANTYLGVGGSAARTIEAWIKTKVAGKEIVSFGENATAQKFSFRLENSGALKLEINGAYVVGTKAVNDGQWHHIAMTYPGGQIGNVKFYIDGKLDGNSSVKQAWLNTGKSLAVQISKGFHNRYFEGDIDDIRIWNTALSATKLEAWMYKKVDSSHPNYANLRLDYRANGDSSIIVDASPKHKDGTFHFSPAYHTLYGAECFKEFKVVNYRPNLELFQGTYNLTLVNDTVVDTTYQSPGQLFERSIYSKAGSIYSDSIGSQLSNYWPANNQLYNLNGKLISSTPSPTIFSIQKSQLNYYERNPSHLEIMSFVTPYGINLDLGKQGKAWDFDVTDFLPVLKGPRRLFLTRGGQNQEDMDIQFLFIVGTPPMDVKDIQQIWKVDSRSYTDILSDKYFPPRTIHLPASASHFMLRSAISGHGSSSKNHRLILTFPKCSAKR